MNSSPTGSFQNFIYLFPPRQPSKWQHFIWNTPYGYSSPWIPKTSQLISKNKINAKSNLIMQIVMKIFLIMNNIISLKVSTEEIIKKKNFHKRTFIKEFIKFSIVFHRLIYAFHLFKTDNFQKCPRDQAAFFLSDQRNLTISCFWLIKSFHQYFFILFDLTSSISNMKIIILKNY